MRDDASTGGAETPWRLEADRIAIDCGAAPGLLLLRLRADDAAARAAAAAALGTTLPRGPATPVASPGLTLYWTAPDAVLIDAGTAEARAALQARLAPALCGHHAALVALGHARCRATLRGPGAGRLLAKGTGLDLDPERFPAGTAALTRLALVTVLLHRLDDTPCFALYADRAAETYLRAWLTDAARDLAP
jgi:heterotetrameric sarcosine oxidase gamma subunit